MPVGELAALLSALTFSFTAIVDKIMTRRFEPLTLGALSTLGGAIFSLALLFALGKADELPDAPVGALLLSAMGGVISVGIGMPLYLRFLRSVDVSKAAPMTSGINTLLAVLVGLVLLGENVSLPTLLGIGAVMAGIYMLTFSQRRQADKGQAQWLGFRGLAFLVFVVSFWVAGTSIQKIALEEVDAITANAVRLAAVFLVLSALASTNLAAVLGHEDGSAAQGYRGRRHQTSAIRKTKSTAARRRDGFRLRPWGHWAHIPHPRLRRHHDTAEIRRIPVRILPPVFWDQIDKLADSLSKIGASFQQMERRGARGGMLYNLDLPWAYAAEEALAAMPEVAAASRVGHWPGSHRIEVVLRSPPTIEDLWVGKGEMATPTLTPRIRELRLEKISFLPYLIVIINGCFSLGLGSLLMLVALQRTGLAVTAVLGSTQLLWIAILSSIALRERLTIKTIGGIGMTAIGVVLVVL
ncbi:MAG: DMT family transporter [Chloroflexi bacterium]|nr:DMT family transporter [Chloroflexota bacterium]